MPYPIGVRPPSPGDGSGICERRDDERERDEEKYGEQWVQQYLEEKEDQ